MNKSLFFQLNHTKIAMMGARQPRFFYGPLLGFFMGLMFSKASAKYHVLDPSAPWYVAEKPPHYNEEEYFSEWHPLTTHLPQSHQLPSVFSSVSGFGEETAAASNVYVRRKPPKTKRRRKNGRPKRRRTTTTTEAYYYDEYYSDEYNEYSEEVTKRPSFKRRRTTTEDYEDSVEITTKPNKRRRKPSFDSASVEVDDVEVTTVKVTAQRQESTTVETTTETATVNATTATTTTTFSGYNGTNNHDNITFTYGPPTSNEANFGPLYTNYGPPSVSRLDYAPFIKWYSQFKSRNDVVKRVQDIVDEEDFFNFADLQE